MWENLDLLGLVVNLDAVRLVANAVTGPGNLLCQLAGAADGGILPLPATPPLLTQVIQVLGLGPVPAAG